MCSRDQKVHVAMRTLERGFKSYSNALHTSPYKVTGHVAPWEAEPRLCGILLLGGRAHRRENANPPGARPPPGFPDRSPVMWAALSVQYARNTSPSRPVQPLVAGISIKRSRKPTRIPHGDQRTTEKPSHSNLLDQIIRVVWVVNLGTRGVKVHRKIDTSLYYDHIMSHLVGHFGRSRYIFLTWSIWDRTKTNNRPISATNNTSTMIAQQE